jgi:hypothetical protein
LQFTGIAISSRENESSTRDPGGSALFLLTGVVHHPAPAITGALLGLYLLFAIKVVQQWEKVVGCDAYSWYRRGNPADDSTKGAASDWLW